MLPSYTQKRGWLWARNYNARSLAYKATAYNEQPKHGRLIALHIAEALAFSWPCSARGIPRQFQMSWGTLPMSFSMQATQSHASFPSPTCITPLVISEPLHSARLSLFLRAFRVPFSSTSVWPWPMQCNIRASSLRMLSILVTKYAPSVIRCTTARTTDVENVQMTQMAIVEMYRKHFVMLIGTSRR